jgi:hypothetical protein
MARRGEDGEIAPGRNEERDRDRSSEGKPLRRLLPQSTDVFGIHESEYPSRHTSCSVDFKA